MQEPETAATGSSTPILDSGALPARARRTTLRGVGIGIILGLLWALIVIKAVGGQFENLYPGLGVLPLVFAIFLAITIHEHATSGKSQQRLKESWLEWQEEIRERQSRPPNVLSRVN